jgi:hypothetical protein
MCLRPNNLASVQPPHFVCRITRMQHPQLCSNCSYSTRALVCTESPKESGASGKVVRASRATSSARGEQEPPWKTFWTFCKPEMIFSCTLSHIRFTISCFLCSSRSASVQSCTFGSPVAEDKPRVRLRLDVILHGTPGAQEGCGHVVRQQDPFFTSWWVRIFGRHKVTFSRRPYTCWSGTLR